jgi:hypothetical protein
MSSSTLVTPSFIVNSRNRIDGTSTNFQYKLDLPSGNDYNAIACISATIPKTYYTIKQGQNEFVVSEGGPSRFVTFPPGNYSSSTFITICKGLLNAGGVGWVYDITVGTLPITNKFTWTVTGNAGVQPIFLFNDDRMHEIMGFNQDVAIQFAADSLTSTNVFNIQHTRYITLKSNIAHNVGNHGPDSSILATISTQNVPDGNSIIYEMNDILDGQRFIANNGSNNFAFSLYDDHDRILDLNGIDFKFKLVMWKHNKFFELAINEIENKAKEPKKIDSVSEDIPTIDSFEEDSSWPAPGSVSFDDSTTTIEESVL